MSNKKHSGKLLMALGAILLIFAVVLTGYNLYAQAVAEKESGTALSDIERIIAGTSADKIPAYKLNPDMEMPVREVDGFDYIGTLYIEQFNLKLPVMSEWSDSNLKKSPCRYYGTVYKDNFVIAAHNYRSHFAKLRNIDVGSKITFSDMDANDFVYRVVSIEVLQPEDVTAMVSSEYDLTLFTCAIGGRTRVTVRCERVQ